MAKKIETTIECSNIAPIYKLNKTIYSESLKFGIFANNGSGKTFISRLFRLTDNKDILTDNIISIGKNNASFSFNIKDKVGNTTESLNISLKRGHTPKITGKNYIYHTFNQDYIDYNIKADNYDKNGNIEGAIIMGAENIDITGDEKELIKIQDEGVALKNGIELDLEIFLDSKIRPINNIRRLKEYSILNYDKLVDAVTTNNYPYATKSYESLIEDYNKLSLIPDDLNDIITSNTINIDEDILNKLKDALKHPFSLSKLNEDFKNKIKHKQIFIESGIKLYNSSNNNECPFCEQTLQDEALNIIYIYNNYLQNEEAKTIRELNSYIDFLNQSKDQIFKIERNFNIQFNRFYEYKDKYYLSHNKLDIINIRINSIIESINKVISVIQRKIENITVSISDEDSKVDNILSAQHGINNKIIINNSTITHFNKIKSKTSDESRAIRNEICRASFNHLAEFHNVKLRRIIELRKIHSSLQLEISQKKGKQQVLRKTKVALIIQSVLNCFFSGKYSFDKNTFRLTFNNRLLEVNQANNVLSEGEKSIVAFAYYLGDVYLKISEKKDFERLFFIIDDPISSMDFTHVYTLCGIIRDIKKTITELKQIRMFIFTHNSEFMRILSSNNIIDTKLVLNNNDLKAYNTTATVPYVHHLMDIYNIVENKADISHTTANSVRHIIETLTKFKHFNTSRANISQYLESNIKGTIDNGTYTLINDLSHGAWREDQSPITSEQFKNICKTIIDHIKKDFEGQFEYCKNSC